MVKNSNGSCVIQGLAVTAVASVWQTQQHLCAHRAVWTVKKAELRRIDAFELECWEDSSESLGLSPLKEFSPECSLEGPMLKLKLESFDHLMRGTDSLEKTFFLINCIFKN